MKKLALAAMVALCIAACSRPSTPTPSTGGTGGTGTGTGGTGGGGTGGGTGGGGTTPTFTGHFLTNMYPGDTLYADDQTPAHNIDTILTDVINDTSYVIFKGNRYYIWSQDMSAIGDTFNKDEMFYHWLIVSPTLDTADAVLNGFLSSFYPHKYQNSSGVWEHQRQLFQIAEESPVFNYPYINTFISDTEY